MRPRLCVFAFLFAVTAIAVAAGPGDWPQWRGPARTGISKETGLLQSWPDGGPKLAWKVSGLGGGYSTPSVTGGKIYLMGAKTQPEPKGGGGFGGGGGGGGMSHTESVLCLDAKDGKELWATEIGKTGRSYPGPRSTPTIDDGHAYAISSDGTLACLDAKSGKLVWKKDLMADFGGKHGFWNYAESPLIDGDKLVCTPGGDAATMVCLDKKTGQEVWRASVKGLKAKAPDFGKFGGGKGGKGGKGKGGFGKAMEYSDAGYASAVVADIGGTKQYVQFLHGGVVGVAAKDGKLLWHYDDPGSVTSCVTPIVTGDSVFASATKAGSGRAKVTGSGGKWKAEQAYFVRELMNHHGGLVLVDGFVYGTGNEALVCLDFKTGEVKWTNRSVGKGSIAYADGHLIVRSERGDVALVEATPTGYKEKGRFSQPERSGAQAWPHPVVAGGKLYLRDWDKLFVYDLKAK